MLDQRGLFDAFDLNSHVLNNLRVDQRVIGKASSEKSSSDTLPGLRDDILVFIDNAKNIKQINEAVFSFLDSLHFE